MFLVRRLIVVLLTVTAVPSGCLPVMAYGLRRAAIAEQESAELNGKSVRETSSFTPAAIIFLWVCSCAATLALGRLVTEMAESGNLAGLGPAAWRLLLGLSVATGVGLGIWIVSGMPR